MISFNSSNIIGVKKLYNMDPCFSWNKISYLDSINYSIIQDSFLGKQSIVNLGLRYVTNANAYIIIVQFSNVTNLCTKNVGGMYNQLLGFEIVDKSKDGWETGQHYYINDYENGIINFTCTRIEVLSIDKLIDI